jgi:hypothetical protein
MPAPPGCTLNPRKKFLTQSPLDHPAAGDPASVIRARRPGDLDRLTKEVLADTFDEDYCPVRSRFSYATHCRLKGGFEYPQGYPNRTGLTEHRAQVAIS